MKPEHAKYALVVWPDSETVSCITLDAVADAIARKAFFVAAEDEDLFPATTFVRVEPAQRNPNRTGEDEQD